MYLAGYFQAFKTAPGHLYYKQLVSVWQCQQGFVDDAVLISKLQHEAALHHDNPVDPPTRKQENMFVCSQSLFEAKV